MPTWNRPNAKTGLAACQAIAGITTTQSASRPAPRHPPEQLPLAAEQDGLLLTLGADPFPAINDVMRCGTGDMPSAQDVLQRASAFFTSHQRGFGIRTRAHVDGDLIELCKARGLFLIGESPGLGVTRPVPDSALPSAARSFELRHVQDAASAADFVQVCSASYATLGLPAASASKLFAHPERLLEPHMRSVVAYDGPAPISAALAFLSHGIGGVYWVGTVPGARGRSAAAYCTQAVTNWCFDQAVSAVALQASKQGEPIYRALGFAEFARYPWFLCGPA